MRISVVPHPDFDSLIAGIADRWIARAPSPVPQPVVIPSLPFSDHLQLRIADRFGVCMGLEFLTPQAFIHRVVGPRSETAWSPRRLAWRILPHVRDFAGHLGVSDPSPRDRLALARLLADQLDQYAHFRPEIVRAWAANKSVFAKDDPDEAWQRELWRTLRADAEPHPAEVFAVQRTDDAFRNDLRRLYPRLLVLGSGALDPLLGETLDALADAGGEVELHVLLPSLEYLGDLRARRALPSPEDDPETVSVGASHPLLESMGRHAAGTFLLLGKLDDQYTHWPEPAAEQAPRASLLGRLQADIRELKMPSPAAIDPGDRSISVHSCFGPRREMEVLRDEILRAFDELDGLRPEDVHIVTPSLEIYAPLVFAVLDDSLPIRLTELPAADGAPAIEAVLALLEMARAGQFEASALLEIIQLESVQAALGIDDADRVRNWIRRCGLMRGIADDDRAPGTWTFSRDRLTAARWFGMDESAKYPDGDYALPVADALGGDDALRQVFSDWHAELEATMREWRVPRPPRAWVDRIPAIFGSVLAEDEDGLIEIQRCLAPLRDADCDEPVDAGSVRDWLEAETQESGRRTPVSGRIPFGRLKQLQNIPCRVLAMVGMQDGAFPGRNVAPAWDLLRKQPRAWDRNARVDDRQLFLDAVLTPRDRLIITAGTRNLRTRKTEPFSACVDELLRATAAMGASRLVVEHRLQPFAENYFNGRAARSFSEEFAEIARTLDRAPAAGAAPFSTPDDTASAPVLTDVSLTQLVEFWKNPAKGFLRAQGIHVPGDEDDDEALDRAPASLDGLSAWRVKSTIIEHAAASADLALAEARLRANRELPPAHLGDAAWHASRQLAEPLGCALRELLGARESLAVPLPGDLCVRGEIQKSRSGDHLLAYRAGEFESADHYLEPWMQAILAAAAGFPLSTLLLDDARSGRPKELPPLSTGEAATLLARLIDGFAQGQICPLRYAPKTSEAAAKARAKGKDEIAAALAEWNREDHRGSGKGDGLTTAAQWAWRDRDPFADFAEWAAWIEGIAIPLRVWGGLS